MPKITDEQRALRRRQILEAAWMCFHRRGISATTMDDIISQAQLSAGAVYLYFPSKEVLIQAAITTSLSELDSELSALLESTEVVTLGQLLENILDTLMRFSERSEFSYMRIALHGWSEAQRNVEFKETMCKFYERFRLRLADRLGGGASSREQAEALLSLILGFIVQYCLIGDVSACSHAVGFAAMLS